MKTPSSSQCEMVLPTCGTWVSSSTGGILLLLRLRNRHPSALGPHPRIRFVHVRQIGIEAIGNEIAVDVIGRRRDLRVEAIDDAVAVDIAETHDVLERRNHP